MAALAMNVILVYVFAIILHSLLQSDNDTNAALKTISDSPAVHCERLTNCMWMLLVNGTFLLDGTGIILTYLMFGSDPAVIVSGMILLTFIFISALVICNMLIGVLCEVVSAVAQGERDEAAIRMMKETILVELQQFDDDGNGMISKSELTHVMKNKQALGVLRSIEVDKESLQELLQMLFYDRGDDAEVSIERVMELLLMYRGNLTTTVKHMVEAHAFNRWCLTHQMKVHSDRIDHHLRQLPQMIHQSILSVAQNGQSAFRPIDL